LAQVDAEIYKDKNAITKSREEIVYLLCDYIDSELANGVALHSISRHILGLFQGCRGAKAWRRYLSENSHRADADSAVVKTALSYVSN
jgi:tRNA-dihydrouridine synthase A